MCSCGGISAWGFNLLLYLCEHIEGMGSCLAGTVGFAAEIGDELADYLALQGLTVFADALSALGFGIAVAHNVVHILVCWVEVVGVVDAW